MLLADMAYIHSIETCGTVDGPGIRYVIFFQGCPLRCRYCHNPDTWQKGAGRAVELEELLLDIQKYRGYMKHSGGGVSATGGEPLLQADFVAALFERLRGMGIHTALDTSGYASEKSAQKVLAHTDLVLLDIKSFNPQTYKRLTGASLAPTLRFAAALSEAKIPVWLRYVLVPGLTDDLDEIRALAAYLKLLKNIERIEILPFHKMGEYKWEALGASYELADTPPPSPELLEQVKRIFGGKAG